MRFDQSSRWGAMLFVGRGVVMLSETPNLDYVSVAGACTCRSKQEHQNMESIQPSHPPSTGHTSLLLFLPALAAR
jgi:hypothetical protein